MSDSYYLPSLEPVDDPSDVGIGRADGQDRSLFQQFTDRRTWSDSDWAWWPGSSNVQGARYCRDGTFRMQVMYGGKTKYKADGSTRESWDFTRIYEYGPSSILTYDFFVEFLYADSKGRFSWKNLDPRWGHKVPVIRLQ